MTRYVVYGSCAGYGEIVSYLLDDRDARLEPLATTPIPGDYAKAGSLPLALSPDQRHLFAAIRTPPYRIETFALDVADGSIKHVSSTPTAHSLAWIGLRPSGRFLHGASYPGSLLVSHRVDPVDGTLGPPLQIIGDVDKAHCVIFDAQGRFAYAAALGENRIRHFVPDDSSGALMPANPPAVTLHPGAGPRHLALSIGEGYLYCVNELDATVDMLKRDIESGAIAPHRVASMLDAGAETSVPLAAADIALHPAGTFLYASERSSSTIATFRTDTAAGSIERIGSVITEASPRAIHMLPSGRLLLAAGENSGRVAVHRVDARSGSLEHVESVDAGTGASWLISVPRTAALR